MNIFSLAIVFQMLLSMAVSNFIATDDPLAEHIGEDASGGLVVEGWLKLNIQSLLHAIKQTKQTEDGDVTFKLHLQLSSDSEDGGDLPVDNLLTTQKRRISPFTGNPPPMGKRELTHELKLLSDKLTKFMDSQKLA